jgi:hypothetical protein
LGYGTALNGAVCVARRGDVIFRAMAQRAWNNWYHAMGNTFGTWLPGDDRGWRSWRHREHCEGDYKHPPTAAAGEHEERLRRSLALMKRHAVMLNPKQRAIAAQAMGEKLRELDVEVIELCVTAMHFHILARYAPLESRAMAMARLYEKVGLVKGNMLEDGRDPLPRHVVGLAKKHASFALREAGHIFEGGVWAKKCKVVPVEDREHQVRAANYVREHFEEGGAVLSIVAPELVVRVRR